MKDYNEARLNLEQLNDACIDCCDFLNHSCVECEDCPIERLKIRLNRIGKFKQSDKSCGEILNDISGD